MHMLPTSLCCADQHPLPMLQMSMLAGTQTELALSLPTRLGRLSQAEGPCPWVQVRMLADTQLELTKGLGLTLDAEGMLGTKRCKR